MNTSRCKTCGFYNKIDEKVGVCFYIGVKLYKDGIIIDRAINIENIKVKGERNYLSPIVRSNYGCIGHRDIKIL